MKNEELMAYVASKVDEANERHGNHEPENVLKFNHCSPRIAAILQELRNDGAVIQSSTSTTSS